MCAQLTAGQRRRYNLELKELNKKYDGLTKHIAALDKELGLELDVERRLVLKEKLDERRAERSTAGLERPTSA